MPVRDNSQRFIESWLAQVVLELFPLNPAINNFRMVVRQVDLARPEAPLKITVCGDGLGPIDRRACGTQTEESHGVEHLGELFH